MFGDRLFSVAIFLIGFSVSAFFIAELLYVSFLHDSTQAWVIYTSFASLAFASIMVGLLFVKLDRLGVALLSGSASIVLGILLDETWLYIYSMPTLFTSLLVVFTTSSFVLGFIWPKIAIILTTSFFGSFFAVKGVSILFGSFPAEILIIKGIMGKRPQSIDSSFHAYLAVILILTVLACAYQFFKSNKTLNLTNKTSSKISKGKRK